MIAEITIQKDDAARIDHAATALERDGVVVIPDLLPNEMVRAMKEAFDARLAHVRWNDLDGYEKEKYRHVVQDVLTLEQGFVDLAIHPVVKGVLNRYLGDRYELVEAKGWKSLPTNRDFHGWHGDAWYDESAAQGIPKEVKLAFYLSDVKSGAFNYVKGSHRKQHPRIIRNNEVADVLSADIATIAGTAGTAFLFDTSGTHRQGVPILEPRFAIFYNYHDPDVRLEADNLAYYRYHPLLLNAAFLGNLSTEDQRVLGFGNKTNFIPAFVRQGKHNFLERLFGNALGAAQHAEDLKARIAARLSRIAKS
jgi:hypothetical protein